MRNRRLFTFSCAAMFCLFLSACVGLLGRQSSSHSSSTEQINHTFVAGDSSFVITTDGRLWASGDNRCGQLGTGDTASRTGFTQVLSGMNVASGATAVVARAYLHPKAANIEAGASTTASEAMASAAAVTAITSCTSSTSVTTAYSTFALKSNGSLYASGNNDFGQLGTGNTSNASQFVEVLKNVYSVVSNGLSTFAIVRNNGEYTLWATGLNNLGQLGLGNTNNQSSFQRVYLDHTDTTDSTTSINDNVASVLITHNGTAAVLTSATLTTQATLWVSGAQLGATTITSATPYEFAQLLTGVSSMASNGYSTVFALKSDQSLWACGDNSDGEFGDGSTVSPNGCASVMSDVLQVVAAGTETLVHKADGTLWVSGAYGPALGLGNGVNTFTQISLPTSSAITELASSGTSSYVLTNDGILWVGGENNVGQLGTGNNTTATSFQVAEQMPNVSSIADVGLFSTSLLVRQIDGSLWSVGNNSSGQLGLSSSSYSDSFTKVVLKTP